MTQIEILDCERAWAAGLYDGEGSTNVRIGARSWAISMGVQQNDREVLDRFNIAIDGQGNVYGPYAKRSERRHAFYQLQVYGLIRVQHSLAVIWPWLGTVKREQAREAIALYESRPSRAPLRNGLRGV